jgi:hypothetical protein
MQNSIKLNNQEIELTPEQVAQIKEIVGIKKGLWKPENGNGFYYIDSDGDVMGYLLVGDYNIYDEIAIGNYFQTKELAQKQIDKLKAIQRVKEYIAENDLGLEPDWGDDNQYKYDIYYDYYYNKFKTIYNCHNKYYSPIGYLKSKGAYEQLIQAKEDDLKIIWEI